MADNIYVDPPDPFNHFRTNYNTHPDVLDYIDKVSKDNRDRIDPAELEYIVVPMKYVQAENLTYGEKILMSFIRMADQKNHCWASNKAFSRWMNVTEKTISNMIVSLKKKGYIEQVSWNGVRRVMRCLK